MPTPLRPASNSSNGEDEGPESFEALFMSAMIEEGEFDPAKYRVTEEDLACYQSLWRFCCDHQSRSGKAPSKPLVRQKFPEFEFTTEVDVGWAASKLREASACRHMRVKMGEAIIHLNDMDLHGAYDAMAGYMVPVGNRRTAYDAFDNSLGEDDFDVTRIPVPWDALGRVTGGIGPGEVWLVAARLGQGKTTIGSAYTARAVREGFNAIYFSMEMPAYQISNKVHMALAGHDKKLLALLTSDEKDKRKRGLDILKERTPGTLGVFDPSNGPTCDPRGVEDAMAEADLVVVDHTMLMKLNGKAAISDWRIAAEISNQLREATLRTGSRLLELHQVNRAGESTMPTRTAKASELGGTDQWGQDAHVIVTMNRFSESVMVHNTEKVRLGYTAKWFSRYEPAKGCFDQISYDKATELAVEDEDRHVLAMNRSSR